MFRKWLPLYLVMALILSLFACGGGAPVEEKEQEVVTEEERGVAPPVRIALESNRDGNFEIYVMDADGSDQQRLTDNPAYDAEPSWSS